KRRFTSTTSSSSTSVGPNPSSPRSGEPRPMPRRRGARADRVPCGLHSFARLPKGLPCEKAAHSKVQNGENRAQNNRHQELGQQDVGAGDGQGQEVRDG